MQDDRGCYEMRRKFQWHLKRKRQLGDLDIDIRLMLLYSRADHNVADAFKLVRLAQVASENNIQAGREQRFKTFSRERRRKVTETKFTAVE